ncbi:MAG: Smr/MutS family protein [Clostridia bacterium]
MEEDLFILKEDILEINLHDMQETEAEYFLDKFITTAPSNIKQINVIHGYKKGQVLLNMVRNKFKHPRIKKKVIPFNKGVTIIYLN